MAELNRSMTLLACQIDVPAMTNAAERDAHTDRVAAAIDAELTAGGPVDLVVLPELGTLDYARSCFDRIDEMAEPLDDSPTIDRLREVAAAHRTPFELPPRSQYESTMRRHCHTPRCMARGGRELQRGGGGDDARRSSRSR